jgi:competence protein ComEC
MSMRDWARVAPTLPVAVLAGGLGLANWLRPWAVGAVAMLVATAAIACLGGRARAVGIAVACLAGGQWWGAMRLDALAHSELVARVGTSAEAVVAVTGPARRTTFNQRMPADLRRLNGRRLRERTLLELPLGRSPPRGALLELRVRVRAPQPAEDDFDERAWLARRGVHAVLRGSEDWRVVGRRGGIAGLGDGLRAHLATSIAPGVGGERRAVVAGIVLGEDEGLSRSLQDDFRASGLYHLLAVSGGNVLVIVLGLGALAWLFGVPRLAAEAGIVLAVAGYVLAVGWQPPVVRAGVAGVLASLAWLASRPRDRWHFLAVAAVVLLAWTPGTLLEPGFQLSFAAVAAIFIGVPRITAVLEGYPIPRRLGEAIAIATVCGIATAPIAWLHFGAVPIYTVPANALAAPVAAPILVLGLVAAALNPVVPAAALGVAWLNGWLASYLAWCAGAVAGLPFAQATSGRALVGIAALLGAVVVAARLPRRRRLVLLAVVGAAALGVAGVVLGRPAPLPPPSGLRILFLDVGQGDGALLQVPEGSVLVDQGPPEARVAQQLRRLGVRRLAALVLTHPQRDHVGGAADVLRRLWVDTVLDPAIPAESTDEREALAAARTRKVPVVIAQRGAVYRLGRLTLRVLWPAPPIPAGGDPNDSAIVLLASYGETDVLLPADAESNVTARLPLDAVEVLKVAHHGSADDGLREQLRVLRPRIAIISVGSGNDYGHPRASTLATLRSVDGLRLFRTDEDGRVTIESDGRRISVSSER